MTVSDTSTQSIRFQLITRIEVSFQASPRSTTTLSHRLHSLLVLVILIPLILILILIPLILILILI
ncbi:MAG: hypothetical protein ACXADB_14300, partial [Candidatus Hermodarchaeia archaeon]